MRAGRALQWRDPPAPGCCATVCCMFHVACCTNAWLRNRMRRGIALLCLRFETIETRCYRSVVCAVGTDTGAKRQCAVLCCAVLRCRTQHADADGAQAARVRMPPYHCSVPPLLLRRTSSAELGCCCALCRRTIRARRMTAPSSATIRDRRSPPARPRRANIASTRGWIGDWSFLCTVVTCLGMTASGARSQKWPGFTHGA
jgi:hypothetical protein